MQDITALKPGTSLRLAKHKKEHQAAWDELDAIIHPYRVNQILQKELGCTLEDAESIVHDDSEWEEDGVILCHIILTK